MVHGNSKSGEEASGKVAADSPEMTQINPNLKE